MKFLLLGIFQLIFEGAYAGPFDEFLQKRFPQCTSSGKSFFFSRQEQEKFEQESKQKLYGRMGKYFLLKCPDGEKKAFIDSHPVRTQNQTLFIILDKGVLYDVAVFNFQEPPEYIAPKAWLDKFIGWNVDKLSGENRPSVDALSGATLTERATVKAVEKILIVNRLIPES